jgi:1-acyl-sn-glycerol-3-phosphate acyltransferase
LFYKLAKGLFICVFSLMGWKIEGEENIPEQGPVIIVANHISNWDPVVVGSAIRRKIRFMAKAELFSSPFLARVMSGLGAFPVKRGKPDIGAIRQSIHILQEGGMLGIFPEGTRSVGDELRKGLPGMVLFMEKTQAPVVLAAVQNTRDVFKRGWRQPPRIIFSEPFTLADFGAEPINKDEISLQIMERLRELAKN